MVQNSSALHGPQCICQICTCGRHQCPHNNRNESTIQLSNGPIENQFRRKEFAVATDRTVQQSAQLKVRKQTEDSFLTNDASKFDATTVSRSDYSSNKKGERFEKKPHKEADIWKTDAKLEYKSVNRSAYGEDRSNEAGIRYPIRKHNSSDVWKNSGKMDTNSVNRSDYGAKRGDRFEMKKPQDSGILKGSGVFVAESSQRTDYGVKRAEQRAELKRPESSSLWKKTNNGTSFVGESRHRQDYGAKKGDRFAAKKHESSGALKSEGKFEAESSHKSDYVEKRGDRFDVRKPESSAIWKNGPSTHLTSSHTVDFGPKTGERYDMNKPEGSDIWKFQNPELTFNSVTHDDFQGKQNDGPQRRHIDNIRRQRSENSDFWKNNDKMTGKSVSQDEYTQKSVELSAKYPQKEPQLQLQIGGDGGTFTSSVSHDDFQGKQGDPLDYPHGGMHLSQLSLGVENAMPSRTISQEEFGLKVAEKSAMCRHENQLKVNTDVPFNASSSYHESFQALSPMPEQSRGVRPPTSLKLNGDRELKTGYQMEFHNKLEPCIAGELVVSAQHDHENTEHFEFTRINKGHHFYQSKENLTT